MFTHRRLLCALLCAAALAASISAAETHAGDVLCFSPSDFGEEITGVCITHPSPGVRDSFAVTTDVYFRSLTDKEILTYIDTAKPYDPEF